MAKAVGQEAGEKWTTAVNLQPTLPTPGEDCFLMKIHLQSLDTLDALLDRFLAFGQTTTSIVQSSPVPERALPLGLDTGSRHSAAQ